MADSNRTQPRSNETRETERERVRGSHDSDQAAEREGLETERHRGDDEATRAREGSNDEEFEDIDPDSAESDVDRDDTIDEP
jgi:hypothetical protein